MLAPIRWLLTLIVLGGITWCSVSVKLGDRTFVQHVRRIWATGETQDLVHGVEDKAKPLVEKVTRGVKAGVEEAGKREATHEVHEATGTGP